MGWLILLLIVASLYESASIILPVRKPNGSVDLDSLVNHLTLLEQTVATLQQESKAQNTEIAVLKSKLSTVQSQLATGHFSAEINSLKDELFATKTELGSVSNDVISVNAELKTMTSEYTSLQVRMNATSKIVNELQNNTDVVRSLQHETSKLQTEVNSTRAALKDQVLAQNNAVRALNMTTKETTLLKTDVALLNNSVLTLMKDLKNTSQTIARMSPIVDGLNEEVYFEVKNPLPYTKEHIVKFQDIQHNIGSGYNPTSGNFTAPVSGIYLFWAQIEKHSTPTSHFTVNLLKNGDYLTYSAAYVVNNWDDTGIVIASVEAKAGDIFCISSSATAIGNGAWSTFGGILLRKH